jgi:hypothetical protein
VDGSREEIALRRLAAGLAVAAVIAGTGGCSSPGGKPHQSGSAPGSAKPTAPATQPVAAIDGYKTVGKFFVRALGATLSCTASVVGPDIIVTAAHCFKGEISGFRYTTSHWTFAPMWHDGQFPYGQWSVHSVYLARNWISTLDVKYDYAVVVLNRRAGHDVAYYTGQDSWNASRTVTPGQTEPVRIVGIPTGSKKALLTVTRATTVTVGPDLTVLKASTPGFGNGTSGGPWFEPFDTTSDTGTIVGLTGGYQAGGATASLSYADFLTSQFASLMAAATKGISHCDQAGDCRYWPS